MDRIDRRAVVKVAGGAGIAFSVGVARDLLTAGEARAQGAPPLSGTWPNRRLLDVLKIEHPIVQAPMGGHVTPDMPVAVPGACTLKGPQQLVLPVIGLLVAASRDRPHVVQTIRRQSVNGRSADREAADSCNSDSTASGSW
jgi:hypothetical protein